MERWTEEQTLLNVGIFASFCLMVSSSFFLGGAIEMQLAKWDGYSLPIIFIFTLLVSGEFFCMGSLIRIWKAEIVTRMKLFGELPRADTYKSEYISKVYCVTCERALEPDSSEIVNGFHTVCGKKPRTVPRYIKTETRQRLYRTLNYEVNFKDILNREIDLNKEVDFHKLWRKLIGRE